MTISTSIRANVRQIINDWGSDASRYSFSSATKTTNEEGDVTVSDWGGATAIKLVSSNHYALRRLVRLHGEDSKEGDRVVIIKDDVTLAVKDKLVIGTDNYKITEIKKIDPIQNTLIAQRVVLGIYANY